MIQANELRLGNYLLFYGEPAMIKAGAINAFDRNLIDVIRHIQPIPLTPEILEKCGFEKVKNGIQLVCKTAPFNECIIAYLFTGPLTLEVYGMRTPLFQVKHLHQLQNLYFALTGEELNVQL